MVASRYHFVYLCLTAILFGCVTSTKQSTGGQPPSNVPWVLTNFNSEHPTPLYSNPLSPLCIPIGSPYTNKPSPQHMPSGCSYPDDHPHHNAPQPSSYSPHTVPQDHQNEDFDKAHDWASRANQEAYLYHMKAHRANDYAAKMAQRHREIYDASDLIDPNAKAAHYRSKTNDEFSFQDKAGRHLQAAHDHTVEISRLDLAKQTNTKENLIHALHSGGQSFASSTMAKSSRKEAKNYVRNLKV